MNFFDMVGVFWGEEGVGTSLKIKRHGHYFHEESEFEINSRKGES